MNSKMSIYLQIYDEKWFKKYPEIPYGYFETEDDWLSIKSSLKKEKRSLVFVSIYVIYVAYLCRLCHVHMHFTP